MVTWLQGELAGVHVSSPLKRTRLYRLNIRVTWLVCTTHLLCAPASTLADHT